jgi:hypothetical protein
VLLHFSDEEKIKCRRWVLDIGVTNHMTGCKTVFSDLDQSIFGTVKFGDGSVVRIEGMYIVLFSCMNGEHHAFTGVYFIPKVTTNIISVGQLDEIGFQTIIEGGVMKIRDVEHRLLVKVLQPTNRLYVLDVELASPVCLAAKWSESNWLWHVRFGHLNFPTLRKLARDGMLRGLPKIEHANQRALFPYQAEFREEEPLRLVHGNLCRPITPAMPTGSHYFLLLVDDCSRFMWLCTVRSKD